jgi:hypothetical protein
VILEGAELDRLQPPQAEAQEDGLLQPFVDDDLPVGHLGHPRFPPVEQVDGFLHPLGDLGRQGVGFVAGVPGGGDLAGEVFETHGWEPPVATVE